MGKRRIFTPSFKLEVVLDLVSGRKSNAALCREHQLAPSVITAWKEQFQERAPLVFATEASEEARLSCGSAHSSAISPVCRAMSLIGHLC